MSGLYGIYSSKLKIQKKVFNWFYSSTLKNIINEEYSVNSFTYGRSVRNEFLNDRILYNDDRFVVGIEGIIYNKKTTTAELVLDLFKRYGCALNKFLLGTFSGFIYDRIYQKIFVFTDHMATRPVYYYYNPQTKVFCFASEMKVISRLLDYLNLSKQIDYDGVYALLNFGYMLDDWTTVKGIHRLPYSSTIEFDLKTNKLNVYKIDDYTFEKELKNEDDILNSVEEYMVNAIEREWQKDVEYGYNHYALLSGGMDSRTNLLIAKEMGYKDILSITFAQSTSDDAKIARHIAKKDGIKNRFFSLDNAQFLTGNLVELAQANDGLTVIIGAAHMFNAFTVLNNDQYGLAHSGQIGDYVFGSLKGKRKYIGNFIPKLGYLNEAEIAGKIRKLNERNELYKDPLEYEKFFLEQKVLNGTLNGDRIISHYTDAVSPFYDSKLLRYCLSIPDDLKTNKRLYINFLKRFHPQVLEFKWDKAGIRPKNVTLTHFAQKFIRYKEGIRMRIGLTSNNMNPYNKWLRSNKDLNIEVNHIYNRLMPLVGDKEVRDDLKTIFEGNRPYARYSVITVLLSLNLHLFREDLP